MNRYIPARQHHVMPGPSQIISPLPINLQRRVCRRHLRNRPGELRKHHLQRCQSRPHVGGSDAHPLRIQRIRLNPEHHRKIIDLVAIEHPPCQLGRLADRDRQNPGSQRIERPAMPHLELPIPAAPQGTLRRRHPLRRAKPQRLVENDPAMHARNS